MSLEQRLQRVEREIADDYPEDGGDSPHFIRIVYDENFYGNSGRLPPGCEVDWPDEELVRV